MLDIQTWFARGRDLGCLPSDAEQVRFLLAWRRGDVRTARSMMLSVFGSTYPLQHVNSAAFPALYELVAASEDGPSSEPEDWTGADFTARLHTGETVDCSWLSDGTSALDAERVEAAAMAFAKVLLLTSTTHRRGQEVSQAVADVMDVATGTGKSLDELVRALAVTSVLTRALPGSAALQAVVPQGPILSGLIAPMQLRADGLVQLWREFVSPTGPTGPLTLDALSRCETVEQLVQAVERCETAANKNLLTYLTARDV